MMSVSDIDELEDASESEVRARLQRKVLDRQRRAVLSEVEALKKYHPYQQQKSSVIGALGVRNLASSQNRLH